MNNIYFMNNLVMNNTVIVTEKGVMCYCIIHFVTPEIGKTKTSKCGSVRLHKQDVVHVLHSNLFDVTDDCDIRV